MLTELVQGENTGDLHRKDLKVDNDRRYGAYWTGLAGASIFVPSRRLTPELRTE